MVKYNELFRVLKKDGWRVVRQKGSHVIMQHPKKEGRLTVPFHGSRRKGSKIWNTENYFKTGWN